MDIGQHCLLQLKSVMLFTVAAWTCIGAEGRTSALGIPSKASTITAAAHRQTTNENLPSKTE